jgi:hypothetical protein
MNAPMAPWLALLRLHVSRIMPHWRGMTVLNTILVALFTSIERGGLDELLQFASAAAASFLFLPPAMVAKARHDGAFRFLGTLPVSAGQHAASWIALCAINALPLAALMGASFVRPPVSFPVAQLPGMVLGLWLFTTGGSSALLAMQLRVVPGDAPRGVVAALIAVVSVATAFGWVLDHAPGLSELSLPLPVLLALASLGSTLLAFAMLGFAYRSIGRSMTFAWAGPDSR